MRISIVINADTRQERDTFGGNNLTGCVSRDFLVDGVINKIKAFDGFEKEVILFIDEHQKIEDKLLDEIRDNVDTLILRKHTEWNLYNDDYYIQALEMARGEYIFHFDQDTAIFTPSKEPINELIRLLEIYDYVSYPSSWSPKAVDDPSFDYLWCSTRFFCCKIETINITEIRKWLGDYDYAYLEYPASRKCHWMEHCLGLISKYKGKGVYYPPIEIDKCILFSWGSYHKYTLRRLNNLSYEEVMQWIMQRGIHYPNDVFC